MIHRMLNGIIGSGIEKMNECTTKVVWFHLIADTIHLNYSAIQSPPPRIHSQSDSNFVLNHQRMANI